jgi:hypothetical protein
MLVTIGDTETGGLTNEHSVLSVGAIVGNLDTGEIVDGFESLVRLPNIDDYNVTEYAMKLNGLDLVQCMEEGETPEEVGQRLVDLHVNTGAALIGGHNFPYDVRMMCANIFKCDEQEFTSMFGYRFLDSCPIIRTLQGVDNWSAAAKLGNACKAMKIDLTDFDKVCGPMFTYKSRRSGFHGAIYDSLGTFRIIHRFRQVMSRPENLAALSGK